jgi:hypothetical protein
MKTTEITVSAKKSRNYQTYEVTKTFTIDAQDNPFIDEITAREQAWCRKKVVEQLNIDKEI